MNTLFRSALIYLSLGASFHTAQAVSHLVPRSTVRTATVYKRMDRPLASAARHYSSKPDIFVDAYYRLEVRQSSAKLFSMLPFPNSKCPRLKSMKLLRPGKDKTLGAEAKKTLNVINKLYKRKPHKLDTEALEWLVTCALPINYSNISFQEDIAALDYLMLLKTSELYKLNVILWKAAQRLKREWTLPGAQSVIASDVVKVAEQALTYCGPVENPNQVTWQVLSRTVDRWKTMSDYSKGISYRNLLEAGVFKLRDYDLANVEKVSSAQDDEAETIEELLEAVYPPWLAVMLLHEEKMRVINRYKGIPLYCADEPYSLAEVVDLLFRILNGPLE